MSRYLPRDTPQPARPRQRLAYLRERDLPRLIGLWPEDLAAQSLPAIDALVRKIGAALRRERQRGRSGHFAYDLSRHRLLKIAYDQERDALTVLTAKRYNGAKPPDLQSVRPPASL